jgi:uncharacterized membrane protein
MSQRKYGSNFVWGIVLVILGLIFLLENFGLDIFEHVWKLWPLVLIIWGWSKLRNGLKSRTRAEQARPEEIEKSSQA